MTTALVHDGHGVQTDGIEENSPWAPGLDDQDRAILKAVNADPNRIVEWALNPVERLGYFDIGFIILNRCIGTEPYSPLTSRCSRLTEYLGTGVFNSASVINSSTQSLGISLIIWMCGCIVALAGTYIYVDFGLTIPRWHWKGEKVSVPRSGGELNYVSLVNLQLLHRQLTFYSSITSSKAPSFLLHVSLELASS
jgi:hypothetical protein